ncbi:armadillo-type protein [Scheffersomyces xylosifermentans]|uniref:armadillo-type protein n=1 Tax=Scheffersomyces xylosifermentans TaxID=1304137 RepID=UPI00315E0181
MSSSQTLEKLKHALDTMYSNAVESDKMNATRFLESFQKSQEAWQVVHTILDDDQIDSIQFKLFAAQTLRSKVTYDLSQLPENNYPTLKDSIINLLIKYPANNQRLIRTQLAISLSQLALQFLSWTNAIEEVITKLSSDQNLLPCLLDVLKILPEELSDVKKTSLTDEEFNKRTQELITNNVEQVLVILKNLTDNNSTNNSSLNSLILDCLNSWIKECPIESILQINSLTSLIFQSLAKEDTFDKSIECLCTIIRETRDIDNYELIDALYKQILELNNFMHANPDRLEDPETFEGLSRLYVEAGESWHVLIAKNAKHFKPLVAILLETCKYNEDLDVVKYTFYFWYLLKQLLTMPKFQESRTEFADIYADLISVIVKHLTYPIAADDHNLFNGDKEQEDKFKDFRYEMGDVLKDCCAVVGAKTALNIPFQQIQVILSSNPPTANWQYLEAPLFSMRAMAKEVPLKEKNILPTIMSFLVQLPEHPKVRYAATLVLGRYTEWTSKNPEFLEPQLNYIIKGFEIVNNNKEDTKGNQDIIVAASRALMYFCQDCSELLVNYLEQLYLLYGQIRDQLDLSSTYELVDGLGHVIKQIPEENLYKTTEMFISPTLQTLTQLLTSGEVNDTNSTLLADQVEIITIFLGVLKCSSFDKPQYPVANLFIEKIWPVVSQLLSKFGKSLIASERILKLVKAAIQSFSTYLNGILGDLANILHEGFKQSRFGCYLWVSGVLIREYGDEYSSSEVQEAVFQFGLQQCSLFFEILFNASEDGVRAIPDVIEDFFRMMNDLLMFYPVKLVPNLELLKSTLKSSLLTLNLINEFDPIISCIHFLIDLVSWGLPNPPISFFDEGDLSVPRQAVQQFLMIDNNGGELLRVVLNGLIFKFHNDVQQDTNDLVLKILVVVPDNSMAIGWLNEVVKALPNVNQKEINKLIETVSVALPNKDNRRVRSSLKDFVNWYSRKNVTPRSEF